MLNSFYYIRNYSYHFTLCFLFTLISFLSLFQFLRINNFFGASLRIMFSIFILYSSSGYPLLLFLFIFGGGVQSLNPVLYLYLSNF